MVDVKTCLDNAQEKMDMAIMYLEEATGTYPPTGKASTRLLDGIRVDSYGSMVPISNVAAVTTPDARSIAIKPWDKSMFRVIEKAIIEILHQTYTDFELIIVNDCSTDSTPKIVSQYAGKDDRIKVINNASNQKLPRSLNIGFAQARGEFLHGLRTIIFT